MGDGKEFILLLRTQVSGRKVTFFKQKNHYEMVFYPVLTTVTILQYVVGKKFNKHGENKLSPSS